MSKNSYSPSFSSYYALALLRISKALAGGVLRRGAIASQKHIVSIKNEQVQAELTSKALNWLI